MSDMSDMEMEKQEKERYIVSEQFEIVNKLGLHARAAVLFIKVAQEYQSEIRVVKDELEVNGKSIMGILMLAATQGSIITIHAEGMDAEDAVRELGKLIENKFGEE
jgi:phosphocarrier protein